LADLSAVRTLAACPVRRPDLALRPDLLDEAIGPHCRAPVRARQAHALALEVDSQYLPDSPALL